ncbi:hypothetical protein H4696_000235 [Amycolatopsis lexingtonensis]|uniref:VWA domain-containing protein n=1 Tax=Amycolatopsis lexingtonensis TaxID=218822 RepID=A0ABR9HQC1_9PSEU|nr:vWA domain-containing protein [Amycolatopsis lexingtonensis]MBE1493135.1 hypothetical protein [Amycolatopsis lexingtonensis]
MSDEQIREELAILVVEALELGTGKNERDVIDDLFSAFGMTFAALDRRVPRQTPNRAAFLRKAAAEQLADAAPTAGALLNEVMRCGGRFVAMIDEIYRYLTRYSATTSGTNETFRLQRADVDEQQLVISPEFIERIRKLEQRLTTFEIGRIDHDALRSFTVVDNGAFYGSWPISSSSGIRLLDGLLALAWIRPEVASRMAGDDAHLEPALAPAGWESAADALAAATAAGERLVSVARWVVRIHLAHIDLLPTDTPNLTNELFLTDRPDDVARRVELEVERYRTSRVITTEAEPASVTDVESRLDLGLDYDLQPVALEATNRHGTAVGALAGFVAQWHRGRSRPRSRQQLEPEFADPAALTAWLATLADAAREAADWLASEVFRPTGTADVTEFLESFEEFLNLPLWRQRDLLYEVWVLCTTIDVCEQGGWVPHLVGAPGPDGVWVLSQGAADEPACRLKHRREPRLTLDVWHEPRCRTADGELTPDVTVSTPRPHRRELVVVEAKDRIKMPHGSHPGETRSSTALGVADRYATGLRPEVTWVVNHCDYRQESDPDSEYGNAWARVRLAEQFRPGNVPEAFSNTIREVITPPGRTMHAPPPGLVLVVDRTKSMAGRLLRAQESLLDGVLDAAYDEFRVIAYADHAGNEPFLLCSLGPFPALADALNAAEDLPLGNGWDIEEALEDAMRRCRELVTDIGPQSVLVLTDAPAHAARDCPYRIDAQQETQALLDLGCRVLVADDWLTRTDPGWARVPEFALLPLASIVAQTRPRPT